MYYDDGYYYMCYNGYQYYLADGTWYWNMWAWSCKYDSVYDVEYFGFVYNGEYYFVAADDSDDYSWESLPYYGVNLSYENGYEYYCYDGYQYWYN